MDLSNQFKYCNTIEDLFGLNKWRRLDLFNKTLRRLHSCMSDTDIYDTYWEIVYKMSMRLPINNDTSGLFAVINEVDYPFICTYAKDAYDSIGSDLLKQPSSTNYAVYEMGILLLMLSFDDQSWGSRVDTELSSRQYYTILVDFFATNFANTTDASEIVSYAFDLRTIGNGDLKSIRNIITKYAINKPISDYNDMFEIDLGQNTIEDIQEVFFQISKFYMNGPAVHMNKKDMRSDVLNLFFNHYCHTLSGRAMECYVYDSYKEDFAWEATGNDGMIYMMDHVTYAYTTFPQKEVRLTQPIVDTYVNDLVSYVCTTSKMINKDNFFTYIRDILNLVIPRIDKYPDTRIYVDAALAKARFPEPEVAVPGMPVLATEGFCAGWYDELMDAALERTNDVVDVKTGKKIGKNTRNVDEDEEDPTPEEEVDPGSGSDIQKAAKHKYKRQDETVASRKIHAAWKKTQDNRDQINKYLGVIGRGLKKCLVGDVRTAIIDGKKITPIEALCRILGTGAIFCVGGPLAGIIATVVQYCAKKSCLNSEKKKILLDLERELEIIEEKIEDAKGDGNKQAKYALMRTRNDLKNAIARIKYGLEADDRSADTAKAVTGNKNARGM